MDVRVVIICSGELDSIKIDGEEMEGLSVIKHKPIPDWFVPSNDRSGWIKHRRYCERAFGRSNKS